MRKVDDSTEFDFDDGLIRSLRRRIREWGRRNFVDYPWRQANNWHGLLAEVFLQRTRASSVVPVYRQFVQDYPTIESLASASEEEIGQLMRPLGLSWRVPIIKELAIELDQLGGVPDDSDKLQELSGIGPYAAAAWISLHENRRAVLVDSNTVRFAARIVGRSYDGETRRKKWAKEFLDLLTPTRSVAKFNYALLDFTMKVCRPTGPNCLDCPLSSYCTHGKARIKTGSAV